MTTSNTASTNLENSTSKKQSQTSPKSPTKKAIIVKGLSQKNGITLETLCKQTSWQAHSVRAVLSTLRKSGMEIICVKRDGKPSLYHLVVDGDDA